MFSPRYYGTTFNVYYATSEAQLKDSQHYHLITSQQNFDIISPDWKEVVTTVNASDLESMTSKKTVIMLPLKSGDGKSAIYLDTKPESPEKLLDALKLLVSIPAPEIKYLALQQIIPTFAFPDTATAMTLHKAVMDECQTLATAFHATLGNDNQIPGPFVDIMTCAYRLRYDNTSAQNIEKTTNDFFLDINRYLLRAWCQQLIQAAAASVKTKAPIYYSRLIPNMVETISIAANRVCINWDDLLEATRHFAECGDISGIGPAAEKLAQSAKNGVTNQFIETQPYDKNNLMSMLNVALVAISGLVVGLYEQDLEKLATKAVDFTKAAITNAVMDDPKQSLNDQRIAYLTELLRFLDGERYEPSFQFAYCVWNLKADEDIMGLLQ